MTEVTQADRDAAKAMMDFVFRCVSEKARRAVAVRDVYKYFAHHAEQARLQERERCARAVSAVWDYDTDDDIDEDSIWAESRRLALEESITAIRKGETA